MYSIVTLKIGLSIKTLCNAVAISFWCGVLGYEERLSRWTGRRKAYLWAALMPFALEWASGHVDSKGSTFDGWTVLGGCLVHHNLADSNRKMLGDVSVERSMVGRRPEIVWYRLGLAARKCGEAASQVRGDLF